ncbi:MAG: peptidoglycan-binding protein [Candidatus Omnitrophica bacterium]|nr:peptidoglycan-binding protein [Candidatus Omnitrophota bacterium]
MWNVTRIAMFLTFSALFALTGCATKSTEKRVNKLQAQIAALTDELVRLDEALQQTRTSLEEEQGRLQAIGAGVGPVGGMYRTPSGFQLPAADIQKALKNAGYYTGPIDGKIGPETREALKAFQRDNGLEADGICGRQTWEKLRVHLGIVK